MRLRLYVLERLQGSLEYTEKRNTLIVFSYHDHKNDDYTKRKSSLSTVFLYSFNYLKYSGMFGIRRKNLYVVFTCKRKDKRAASN